jgi:hypothetical protein
MISYKAQKAMKLLHQTIISLFSSLLLVNKARGLEALWIWGVLYIFLTAQ